MSLVCLSSANSLQAFLCIIFRRGFLLGRQPCRPIWCSAVYGLSTDRLTPSTSSEMLAALIRLFTKHNLWIWRWARALNFFGRPWRGLFWMEPVTAVWSWPPCCSSVSGSWQSSYSLRHLYIEQLFFFFRYSESSLLWGAMLNFQWPVWESESDNTKCNTPAPHSPHSYKLNNCVLNLKCIHFITITKLGILLCITVFLSGPLSSMIDT